MSLTDKVFGLVSLIPKGKVVTYKAIADKLGIKGYRAIGQILKHNQNAPLIPCHRVVKSDGSLGGYLGNDIATKIKLLRSEGVEVVGNKLDLNKFLMKF